MTACREQILAAVATALGTITSVAGLAVERERGDDQPVDETELPRLVVIADDEAEDPIWTGERDYSITVAVEGYVAAASALEAQQAAAVLRAEVDRVLLAEPFLGGLQIRDLRIEDEGEPARLLPDGADAIEAFVRQVVVEYATAETDPDVFV